MKRVGQQRSYPGQLIYDDQLNYRVSIEDEEKVLELLEQGARIDHEEIRRGSTLAACINTRNDRILEILLSHSPTIDFVGERDKTGITPWMMAVGAGYEFGYKRLQAAGADIYQTDAYGRNAFYYALGASHVSVPTIEYLFSQKVNPWVSVYAGKEERSFAVNPTVSHANILSFVLAHGGADKIFAACLLYHMCDSLAENRDKIKYDNMIKCKDQVSQTALNQYFCFKLQMIPNLDERLSFIDNLIVKKDFSVGNFLSEGSMQHWIYARDHYAFLRDKNTQTVSNLAISSLTLKQTKNASTQKEEFNVNAKSNANSTYKV